MRHPRSVHSKSLSVQNKPTGTQKKNPSAPKKGPSVSKKAPSVSKQASSVLEKAPSVPKYTLPAPAQEDPSVTAEEPPPDRRGLANSLIGRLAPELRDSIMQFEMQHLRKVSVVPRALLTELPNISATDSSLVFTSTSAISKTCYDLHTRYAHELQSRVLRRKIPSLDLHVLDFDFAPLITNLFCDFGDSHRTYYNARKGAITIYLTLTPSFFARAKGARGSLLTWLAKHDIERTQQTGSGLGQWLDWTAAEEQAGRKIFVEYEVKRDAEIEGVEDREALRMLMNLFNPLSKAGGEVGEIVKAVIAFFEEVNADEANRSDGSEEDSEEDSEEESEEDSMEE